MSHPNKLKKMSDTSVTCWLIQKFELGLHSFQTSHSIFWVVASARNSEWHSWVRLTLPSLMWFISNVTSNCHLWHNAKGKVGGVVKACPLWLDLSFTLHVTPLYDMTKQVTICQETKPTGYSVYTTTQAGTSKWRRFPNFVRTTFLEISVRWLIGRWDWMAVNSHCAA